MLLLQRLPGDSIYHVLVDAAKVHGDRTALKMLMTGADDEQARSVSFVQLPGLVRQAANLFSGLGGARPGIAYMLPTPVETHAEAKIGERPAWPKHIYAIPAIPLTADGKIFKPALRKDVVARAVELVLRERKLDGAEVAIEEGGARGMIVNVKLGSRDRDSDDARQLQEILNGYLFETKVTRS